MIRFFQQLGCYIGIPLIPSTDTLTAEDHRVFISGFQLQVDCSTDIHECHSFVNCAKDSNLASKSVDQEINLGPVSQSLPSKTQAIKQSIGTIFQDTFHSKNSENTRIVPGPVNHHKGNSTGYIGLELHPDRSTAEAAEQGPVTMFQNSQHLNFSGNARIMNIGHQHVNSFGNCGLDNLKEFVLFNAFHDSSAQDPERCCHPGTRKNVLHKIRTWMNDPNAPERISWLNGPAGVGKSAIAQTISYSYGRDKVGASFFFFRSGPTRNDGNRLFPTLAWRLASSVPNIKDLIAVSLEEDPDLLTKCIETQFEQLIAQPFLTISGGESTAPTPSRVIIIDGLDECSDVKMQRRILKILGNAIANTRFPLRFIISSRPEAHIEDFFARFKHLTLQIDLVHVEGAYRDIKTYLTSEFARIAVEQELDPEVWPGQDIIDTLVSQSSGQFLYASTVIKYVDDEYESAVARLNIILERKPSAGESLFSELDSLYTETLQRQPDKTFLKNFLAVLVARRALSLKDLHEEDAVLLGLNKNELHRKLRGMRSVLKYKPFIDVHHKSFLDFIHDPSRPGEYHVSKHSAKKRYMELIMDVLVKAASKAMEQPDSHGSDHFQPRFARIFKKFPIKIKFPLNEFEEILQPLLVIKEKLLQLPNMSLLWTCEECWTFYMIDDLLLHLACFRGTARLQEPKYAGIRPLTAMEEKQIIPRLDLDTCLSLLLSYLRSAGSQFSLNKDTIGLVRALIHFDPTETAMKVRSITDAQNLVELIFCLNKKECFKSWFGAVALNATRLALAIYGRVPVLPRLLFSNSAGLGKDMPVETYQGKTAKIWDENISVWRDCFSAFLWGNLSHDSIAPCLATCLRSHIVKVSPSPENKTLDEWRRSSDPSVSKIQATIFEVAKAIQYVHSLGTVICYPFEADDVYFDSGNHVRFQCPSFRPNVMCKGQSDYDGVGKAPTSENDIRKFGLLFYQVLFNDHYGRVRPSEPQIPDNIWQLIRWCCAKDPKERPTIDQIIQEMESWISLGQFTLST